MLGSQASILYNSTCLCNVQYIILFTFRFKDFASEVRGNMDVDSLLDEAAVILDLTGIFLSKYLALLGS